MFTIKCEGTGLRRAVALSEYRGIRGALCRFKRGRRYRERKRPSLIQAALAGMTAVAATVCFRSNTIPAEGNDMTTPIDEQLDTGLRSLGARYNQEHEEINRAKKLAEELLEQHGEVRERELADLLIAELRKRNFAASEYIASYATDYLRSSGKADKDWVRGTLRHHAA